MTEPEADIKADISAVMDSHESVALMEPMLVAQGSQHRGDLIDLAVEVAAASAGFRRSLPDGVRTPLGDLVRAMNCYYSNLIEGHDTHPIDIERALNNDYSRRLRRDGCRDFSLKEWNRADNAKGFYNL